VDLIETATTEVEIAESRERPTLKPPLDSQVETTMKRRFFLLGLASVGFFGCSAYSKPDFERIQGMWIAVTIQNDGRDVPTDGQAIDFAAGRLTNFKNGAALGPFGSYRIDDNKQPKWLDIHDDKRNLDIVGIYELDGDTLKICLNERAKSPTERPTEFKSAASGASQVLMVFTRQK